MGATAMKVDGRGSRPVARPVALALSFTLGSVLGFCYSFLPQQATPLEHDFFRFRTECAPPLQSAQVIPEVIRRVYTDVSPYTNFPPEHVSAVLSSRPPQGWGSTDPVFEELVRQVRPRIIIEAGSFLGASALHMANLTRQLGLESTPILCLDDFRGWVGFRWKDFSYIGDVNGDLMLMYEFMWNVVQAGEQHRVMALPFSTALGLDSLCDMGIYGDLVEVDAGHDFHSAWVDINRAWAVVRNGGVLFGHDYENPTDDFGVRRAVQLFAKTKGGLQIRVVGAHWVLHPPKGTL